MRTRNYVNRAISFTRGNPGWPNEKPNENSESQDDQPQVTNTEVKKQFSEDELSKNLKEKKKKAKVSEHGAAKHTDEKTTSYDTSRNETSTPQKIREGNESEAIRQRLEKSK